MALEMSCLLRLRWCWGLWRCESRAAHAVRVRHVIGQSRLHVARRLLRSSAAAAGDDASDGGSNRQTSRLLGRVVELHGCEVGSRG